MKEIPEEVKQIIAVFCRAYGPLNIVRFVLNNPRYPITMAEWLVTDDSSVYSNTPPNDATERS